MEQFTEPSKAQSAAGSAEYYLRQMEESLIAHGETRVRWSWAINRMCEWRDLACRLGAAHYVLNPDLRAAKHRDALRTYEQLIASEK